MIKDIRRRPQVSNVALEGDEIRRSILHILYSQIRTARDDPWVNRDALCSSLGVEDGKMVECIDYLLGKGLLEVDGASKEAVRLSQKGLIQLDARMGIYCPYL